MNETEAELREEIKKLRAAVRAAAEWIESEWGNPTIHVEGYGSVDLEELGSDPR